MNDGVAARIRTLLIANRGEIALRIIRTAQVMGIRTVVVFSDADEDSQPVRLADAAIRIGPPQARESYLAIDKVIAAAKASGADAVHPGYGFLAENADFAEACAQAGLVFVGPPPDAIRAMGDKAQARVRMAAAGIPMLRGYDGDDQSPAILAQAAEAIGFPVLIKPSAGGGGKGMHVVERADDFASALLVAQREAASAFGDGRVILERYLGKARHIEVQVFADAEGRTVHLFDRDCSVQRRHQKVIEEAPAPDLSEPLRQGLQEAAITCARSVGYVGAGTVEFLVAGEHFFFMEMNTRLQVEHPVTEAITGFDLVEWQLRVANGEALPARQESIVCRGHAIEVRLCAEDPDAGFLPSSGRIDHLLLPADKPGIRVDSGVCAGQTVSVHYDSLLAKIIAHGVDRPEAIARLDAALAGSEVVGPATNRTFLTHIVKHPAFAAGSVDTRFIEHHQAELLALPAPPDSSMIAAAAFVALRLECSAAARADPADPFSPWLETGSWRLGGVARQKLELEYSNQRIVLDVIWQREGYRLAFDGKAISVTGESDGLENASLSIDGVRVKVRFFATAEVVTLFTDGGAYAFTLHDPRQPRGMQVSMSDRIVSPMPGLVLAVAAAAGDSVEKGQSLVVIEAMKMEHTVSAPRAGMVSSVDVGVGDQVIAGAELVVLEAEA